ncbi:Mrto4 protein [Capsaspora owczarzaki ATCC 30864]|uniref:Ribosome assembly factor mrt4 n=1 Tax=Capsaspora owczarzaki (strain ATCC 30864) TaxID=595528 RepID=A0A0D2WIY4_CAPO3|nr:Mrto4 protein [Capsaspora owczarzaki ATCC 30864]KJE89103.1 Mrto4 protein [Capsaspora owczarzaki ATCC 30864]|eukprot:XP_004365521.2 Mrto4 protein [Capsaspora owczarzaki ATCC 30864]
MPKSKRVKKVALTRTEKHGMESKDALVNEIRSCIQKYSSVYVFAVRNMRNIKLKDVRSEWKHSRFFFGKNRVMALALGNSEENEQETNLREVSNMLVGQTGLLFTSQPREEVIAWFENHHDLEFARSGFVSSETVKIPAGPLPQFSHTMHNDLLRLGLPIVLNKGIITLEKPHTVCSKGDTLTPEQARILKLIDRPLADFHIKLKAAWSNGEFEVLSEGDDDEQGQDGEDYEDDEDNMEA